MPDDVESVSGGSRDDMAAAFDAVIASESPVETPAAPAESAPGKEAPAAPVISDVPQEGPQRDDKGRFVPGAKKPGAPAAPTEPKPATPPGVTPGTIGQPVAPPPQVEPGIKPPQSLKPAEREEFVKAPRAIQEALVRRERETQTALNESARAREFEGQFRNTVGPYEAMLRSEGVNPLQAVDTLMRLSYDLRNGTPERKAQILAHHVRQFLGTDEQAIALLAKHIDGSPQAQQPQALDPQRLIAQAKQEFLSEIQQRQAHALDQEAQAGLAQFQAEHEFMGDHEYAPRLRRIMSTLMRDAAEENQPMSYDDAYKEALLLHPETKGIVQQREAAKAAANGNASTQRAKLAASSVRSQPGGTGGAAPPGDDWRAHLEAAWDKAAS